MNQDVERANSTLESIEVAHSLLAAWIGGALSGLAGSGDGGMGGFWRAGASASGIGMTQPITLQPAGVRGVRQVISTHG